MAHSVITAVSFERTPVPEIGWRWMELNGLGWEWIENLPPRWIARFEKRYADAAAGHDAEDEIRSVMGDFYVSADELKAGAADPLAPLP